MSHHCRALPVGWPRGLAWMVTTLPLFFIVLALTGGAEEKPSRAELPADLELARRWNGSFVSIRAADFLALEHLQQLPAPIKKNLEHIMKEAEEKTGLKASDAERITVVLPPSASEPVAIVRTTKAIDADKLVAAIVPDAEEKKVGKVTLYQSDRGPMSLAILNDNVFAVGSSRVLPSLVRSRDKSGDLPTEPFEMAAGKHLAVAGFQPMAIAQLRFMEGRRALGGPVEISAPKVRDFGIKGSKKAPQPKQEFKKAPVREGEVKLQDAAARQLVLALALLLYQPDHEDMTPEGTFRRLMEQMPPEALPYKPLFEARYVAVAVDVGESLKLTGRVFYDDAEGAKDGETALRTLFYVGRQAIPLLMRENRMLELENAPKLRQAIVTVRKALRSAEVERTAEVVKASVSLPIDLALVKQLQGEFTKVGMPVQAINNMKQIALAMHNYHSTFNALPGAAICDADGKPLLSWRVLMLPYIEEDNLYRQFKLDEPWDSENNKKLLARMPKVYAPVGETNAPANSTFYRGFVGENAIFPPPKAAQQKGQMPLGRQLFRILDGTSNTLLIVEAGEAVPWTKPEELPYDPNKPLPKMGGQFKDFFLVAFCDGSVRKLPKSIAPSTLHALITPSGGEVVDFSELEGGPRRPNARPRFPEKGLKKSVAPPSEFKKGVGSR